MICLHVHYFFHLPNKYSDIEQEEQIFITTFFLSPWALRHNISCLVHLNKVDLIKAEFSEYNLYLTKKSVYEFMFLWNTQGNYKEQPSPKQVSQKQ